MIGCMLLVVATLAFYNPIGRCGFVYSDDVAYVMKNPAIRGGLSWHTVKWAFDGVHAGFWHPLTWLSHALDYQLFGLNPAGHHYVSLLFHAANAVLLFVLLLEATAAWWPSLIVAALFALHPENVESVAWAAERKNVLSMFFFLLALWVYGRYARRGGVGRYLAVVLLFALGLMSKPQVITLPCVLLLWDYWPLGRMFVSQSDAVAPRSVSYLLKEKIPLFLLAAASSAITVWTQKVGSALQTLGHYSLAVRLSNAVVSYTRYLAHTFWPVRLSPIYAHPGTVPSFWILSGSIAILIFITACVLYWRKQRYLLVGWLWFLGTLVPMIGIVQVGEQAMADRFAYIPMIGLLLAVVWGIDELASTKSGRKVWIGVPTATVLIILGVLTYQQLGYWRDGETLWGYAIRLDQRNYLAHANLAMVFGDEGKTDGAIREFRASEEFHEYPPEQVLKIGIFEQRNGHLEGAIEQYQKVVQGSSDAKLRAVALTQIGAVYVQMSKYEQAKQSYENALQVDPNNIPALVANAMLEEREGQFDQAAGLLAQAMKYEPSDTGYLLMANALRHAGRLAEAQQAEDRARTISSNLDAARKNAAETQLFFGYKE